MFNIQYDIIFISLFQQKDDMQSWQYILFPISGTATLGAAVSACERGWGNPEWSQRCWNQYRTR